MRRDRNEYEEKSPLGLLLGIVVLFVLVMCILSYYFYTSRSNIRTVTLTENGIVNAELDTNFGTLLPGQSRAYTLEIECKAEGTYRFCFVYEAKEQSPLGKYVTVELNDGEEKIASGNLGELLASGELVTTLTFTQTMKTSFTISYIMHDDVGDEAQGATLDFDLKLMVKKME